MCTIYKVDKVNVEGTLQCWSADISAGGDYKSGVRKYV